MYHNGEVKKWYFMLTECINEFYTYLLTPWRRALLEKLTVSQLVKKLPMFYQWRTQETFFFWGGDVQQVQLRTKGRENGDLGTVAP
jgi:hypothetical protein